MSRGGMVYVKRDVRNEEAPRTFQPEQGSVFLPWLNWTQLAFSDPSLELPALPSPPAGVSQKTRAAARRAFLDILHKAGPLPVVRHIEVIRAVAPALGWPWEGVDGSRYASAPANSWLLAGGDVGQISQGGWIEWATATVGLMKDPSIVQAFIPAQTVLDPWQPGSVGQRWCYEVLNSWWRCGGSASPPKNAKEMAGRWEALVASIDERLHCNPSSMGLPLHWQVSARQAEKCLLLRPAQALYPMDPLPPVHTQVRIGGKDKMCWMGVAEWALWRFSNMVHSSRDWPATAWEHFRVAIEEDVGSRHEGTLSLLTPFRDYLLAGVSKFSRYDPALLRAVPDTQKMDLYRAEIDAWWLGDLCTARVSPSTPGRARRL